MSSSTAAGEFAELATVVGMMVGGGDGDGGTRWATNGFRCKS